MREKNNFFSGITELLILAILEQGDSYVYDITKIITEKSNGVLNISQNTVYAATYKLETEKKISQYSKLVGKRRVRIYCHLEEKGKEYYKILLSNFREAFSGVEKVLNDLTKLEGDADDKDM